MRLPPHATWDGRRVGSLQEEWDAPLEVYASIESTNQRALDWSRSGALPWSTVIADEQTEGRGRRGKRWESRAGLGLWMSVVVPAGIDRGSALTLYAGLVAARAAESAARAAESAVSAAKSVAASGAGSAALESATPPGMVPPGMVPSGMGSSGPPSPPIQVRWPNDLELEGKKIAGVLCEVAQPGTVVVGIGFNVLHGESDFGPLDRPAASLKAVWGVEVSRSLLAAAILRGLKAVRSFDALDDGSLAELRSRDVLAGRTVEGSAVAGTAAGIDREGALLVDTGADVVRVVGGTIALGGPIAPSAPIELSGGF